MTKPMANPLPHDAPAGEAAAAAGLSAAAVQILVANHARFLAFLERRVGSREIAEEILQEAFVRGLSRGAGARLRDDESAVAWFYRLLRNAIVDRARRASAEHRTLARLKVDADPDATQPDHELVEVICGCIESLLGTLAPAHERALRRVELGAAPLADLAAAEGITPGHAAVRVHRARQALRRRLEDCCGTCATHGCRDCACGEAPPAARRPPPVRAGGPRRASPRGT
jgi:RNA polymerase sigma-70 factor (ECF subfamily)